MAEIICQNITKSYGATKVVPDFNLHVKDHEFVVFLGPSGCGKSTMLRMMAGLEDITGGQLKIAGKVVNDLEPKDRGIAMVFQNYALYPHMTIRDNIAFGLRRLKVPEAEITARTIDVTSVLGLGPYLDRKPTELSGGQQQRVAIARAMIKTPDVFLFDEPLSNLDAKLRATMREEIARLHKKLRTTTVYVTHDQMEAMTLADRIVLMKDGNVITPLFGIRNIIIRYIRLPDPEESRKQRGITKASKRVVRLVTSRPSLDKSSIVMPKTTKATI